MSILETMFFQFLSENGQATPMTQKTIKFSKNLMIIQYINKGYIMLVKFKSDKTLNEELIEKLVSRHVIEIESITFTRA